VAQVEAMKDILPDCRPKVQQKVTRLGSLNWVPIYCANCGSDGGLVPEETNFAFYLCIPCSEKWDPPPGTWLVPDEVFWQRVAEESSDSSLAKLARDRQDFSHVKMT
jgi:hypothetical protein